MLCTAISTFVFAQSAAAQNAQPANGAAATTQLQEIVVKGKRKAAASAASDTPLATQTSADVIQKKDIQNIRDLGNSTEPGVDFVDNKPGKTGGLFIRGLTGARVTTLVDGIALPLFENFARNGQATSNVGSGNTSFDFGSLAAIDVVRGADSSRLGGGALGGALVLRTLEANDLIAEGRDFGGVAKTTYDSEDRSIGGDVAVAKKIENTSVLFQGAYRRGHEAKGKGDNDVLGIRRTVANPSDYDQSNLMFKLQHELDGGHKIGLTAERFEKNVDTDLKTLQTSSSSYKAGAYSGYDDVTRQRLSLDYDYEAVAADAFIRDASAKFYWQSVDMENGSSGLNSSNIETARHDRYKTDTLGVTGNLTSKFETGNVEHTLRVGADVSRFDFEENFISVSPSGTSTTTSRSKDMPDVKGWKAGIYVEDELAFGDSGFRLTPGLRFDYFDYNPSGDLGIHKEYARFGLPQDMDGARLSPKLLASYDLTPETELFAQWSMGYRAPTINELYIFYPNLTTGYVVLGNPSLKAETSHGFEIGANYQSGDLSGRLTVFHNKYSNFIDSNEYRSSLFTASSFIGGGNGWIQSFTNRANVTISGVELKARKEFTGGFFTQGSFAYSYGKDNDTNEFIRTVAPFKAVIGVGYEAETWGTELTGIFSASMRKEPAYTSTSFGSGSKRDDFDAPGYGLFNLTGWWEPEQTKGLRIQAGVYNLFDKTYYNGVGVRNVNTLTPASGNQPVPFYSEPGRSFKISLTQKF
jgi:hemoglobin/transferrin/lactoferrin receptor protein